MRHICTETIRGSGIYSSWPQESSGEPANIHRFISIIQTNIGLYPHYSYMLFYLCVYNQCFIYVALMTGKKCRNHFDKLDKSCALTAQSIRFILKWNDMKRILCVCVCIGLVFDWVTITNSPELIVHVGQKQPCGFVMKSKSQGGFCSLVVIHDPIYTNIRLTAQVLCSHLNVCVCLSLHTFTH